MKNARVELDVEQVTAQIVTLDRRIMEAEVTLRKQQSECDRLRGRREVWRQFMDELVQNATL